MDALKALLAALLLMLAAAITGWFNGSGHYIGWGLATTIAALAIYILFRR